MKPKRRYITRKLLEFSRTVNFQTFEIFFKDIKEDKIVREYFFIKPERASRDQKYWNEDFGVLELSPVALENKIINEYPERDTSLSGSSFYRTEIIIINDLDEIDINQYSYVHKIAYENEYRKYLIKDKERKPKVKSMVMIPIFERGHKGILRVMNRYRRIQSQSGSRLAFTEVTDSDIDKIITFASGLSNDLSYSEKFGLRRLLIPTVQLNEKEKELYNQIKEHSGLVGKSVAFNITLRNIAKACANKDPVLIIGETGTGKTFIAKIISDYWKCPLHFFVKVGFGSKGDVKLDRYPPFDRDGAVKEGFPETLPKDQIKNLFSKKEFRSINLASIPETLFESELIGIVKGSATGVKSKFGHLISESGYPLTVLLDEIGNVDYTIQGKLLKIIEEKEANLVGSFKRIPLDNVRIIAATNKDIRKEIQQKTFRKDLYYRFKTIIYIPPLRERKEDIEAFIEHFLKIYNELNKKNITISVEANGLLKQYSLQGNVRELESIISKSLDMLMEGETEIERRHLPREIVESVEDFVFYYDRDGYEKEDEEEDYTNLSQESVIEVDVEQETVFSMDLKGRIEDLEKEYIIKALKKSGGKKSKAAKYLGIPMSTLCFKIEKFGLTIENGKIIVKDSDEENESR